MKNNNFELTDCNNPTASSSNNDHGAKLIWRNVSVFAKADPNANKFMRRKKKTKRIINNSTGCVKPGVLLAVMGARYQQIFRFIYKNTCDFNLKRFHRELLMCEFQWGGQKYADVDIGIPQSDRYNREG